MLKTGIQRLKLIISLSIIFTLFLGSPDYLLVAQQEAPAFINTASTQDVVLAVAGMT